MVLGQSPLAIRGENLVPNLVPDSTELSRTPCSWSALTSQIRLSGHLPAELL